LAFNSVLEQWFFATFRTSAVPLTVLTYDMPEAQLCCWECGSVLNLPRSHRNYWIVDRWICLQAQERWIVRERVYPEEICSLVSNSFHWL